MTLSIIGAGNVGQALAKAFTSKGEPVFIGVAGPEKYRGVVQALGERARIGTVDEAIAAGEANATVELTPNMAGPALDAIIAYKDKGTTPPKWIQTESKLYTASDDPQKVYDSKKGLGY